MIAAKTPNQYHHGQLKRALLEAIDTIVSNLGVEKLTLRECARRAGVSHGAPAHHFGDKQGMLSAYAIEGYERLMGNVAFALDSAAPHDHFDRLHTFGVGYIQFAGDRRAQFSIMTREELLDLEYADLREKRALPFDLLARLASQFWSQKSAPGWSNQNLARIAVLWSMIHGAAILKASGQLDQMGISGLLDPRPAAIVEQALIAFSA